MRLSITYGALLCEDQICLVSSILSAVILYSQFGLFLSCSSFHCFALNFGLSKVCIMAGEVPDIVRIIGGPENWEEELPPNHSKYFQTFNLFW